MQRARRSRGFTLIELLAVVALMAVLAAVASPAFVQILRDRRVNDAAMRIANYYRTAKMLAMGRGLPILVNWNAEAGGPGQGLIQIVEPVLTTLNAGASGMAPYSMCSQVAWAYYNPVGPVLPAGGVQFVDAFNLADGYHELPRLR